MVSTAVIADATPGKSSVPTLQSAKPYKFKAALCSHTRDRAYSSNDGKEPFFQYSLLGDQFAAIVAEYLNNAVAINSTFTWPTGCSGPDVVFGWVPLISLCLYVELTRKQWWRGELHRWTHLPERHRFLCGLPGEGL